MIHWQANISVQSMESNNITNWHGRLYTIIDIISHNKSKMKWTYIVYQKKNNKYREYEIFNRLIWLFLDLWLHLGVSHDAPSQHIVRRTLSWNRITSNKTHNKAAYYFAKIVSFLEGEKLIVLIIFPSIKF